MLSKQLQEQIEQEAVSRYGDLPNGIHTLQRGCYKRGAGKYAALYETALARAERAEKALKEIAAHTGGLIPQKHAMIAIARNALTPKTGEDE